MAEQKKRDWHEMEMNLAYVKKIIDHEVLKRTLLVILSGGEPLLNKDTLDIIRFVKSRKKLCGMITNGLLLKDHILALKNSGLDEIQISIYDHTFDKLQNILNDIVKLGSGGGGKINMSYVLLKSNLENNPERIERVIHLCKDAGCHSLKFNICTPFAGNTSETIYDDNNRYTEFVKKIRSENRGFSIICPEPIPKSISHFKEKRCLMPWQQILINGAGEINMCCHYESMGKTGGNINETDDSKSFNSEDIRMLRRGLLSKDSSCEERCCNCIHLTGTSAASRL
jgi:MoaA/NifB/PqqE/SkfB family radical SAM enzyme